MKLPAVYISYAENPENKAEGFLDCDPGYFILWPPAELEECNRAYEVASYAPGFVGFGSSGGSELLAFDTAGTVYMLPMIGLSPDHAIKISDSWEDFVSHIEPTA